MNYPFKDYEASYITPQKTLLKKLNAILKYLEKVDLNFETKLYKHKINLIHTNPSSSEIYEIIDNIPSYEDLSLENIKEIYQNCISMVYLYTQSTNEYVSQVTNIKLTSAGRFDIYNLVGITTSSHSYTPSETCYMEIIQESVY